MNVKKIKHALNCCVTNECDICAYAEKMICFNTLLQDACTAIEEQEERIAIMQESMEALEKRNEPVSPIVSQEIFGTFLMCGNCGEKLENVLEAESINGLPIKWQYCRKCGQAVKWE